jgi:uncharacterized phage protein (predicted DNA packaging)
MIELNEIKHQCRIDTEDDHDDQYLLMLVKAAQQYAARYMNRPVRWDGSSTGHEDEIPMYDDIKLAVLMLVSGWFENREHISDNAIRKVPMTIDLILGQYRIGTLGYVGS